MPIFKSKPKASYRPVDYGAEDPLRFLSLPPVHETPEDRDRRLMCMREAQRVSREIDESIAESKKLLEKKKKAVKVLVLGPSCVLTTPIR